MPPLCPLRAMTRFADLLALSCPRLSCPVRPCYCETPTSPVQSSAVAGQSQSTPPEPSSANSLALGLVLPHLSHEHTAHGDPMAVLGMAAIAAVLSRKVGNNTSKTAWCVAPTGVRMHYISADTDYSESTNHCDVHTIPINCTSNSRSCQHNNRRLCIRSIACHTE
jgi:hypothetical protein